MKITICKTAGFCFGVNRAIEKVLEAIKTEKQVVTLGEIIHNAHIVKRLETQGVILINELCEIPENSTVIIRSHGESQDIYDYFAENKIKYIDATCPFVAKIHKIVKENYYDETLLLIAGDETHPEVKGILGHWNGEYISFKDGENLTNSLKNIVNITKKRVVVVAQTTFNIEEWEKCKKIIKKVCTNPFIFDTICSATAERQKEASQLAEKSDIMIVVGGRHSSNTKKLESICESYCKTILIEDAEEISKSDFKGMENVGITAGASTPAWIIKEVQDKMSEINTNEELSFEEMLEQSFKSTYTGEKITGIVTSIAPNEITVDIGTKHAGYIPLSELTDDPTAKAEDLVKKGDELELLVMRVNDVEGIVMLSKKRLDAAAGFEKVMNAVETGEILHGVVTEAVKGGVLAITNGVKVFIPISQISLNRVEDLTPFIKKQVSFKILEVNRQRRRAVASVKAVLKDERKVVEDKFWETIEIGNKYKGTVKSLTDFGAFVDLGGVDGMIHVSELSWTKIKHPSQVVSVGDTVEVFVKDLDAEKRKISLGYKKTEDNPWEIIKTQYPVGTATKVKIVSITAFGAFAQIIPGVDGLIHISQISTERIEKPSDVLKVGQEVDVKITDIDFEAKRISLSMKALLETEEASQETTDAE
ncbi:MAG: bifunctional 4-hydroxy-3-methylbut-2-enyl diphosphate reductase/30S ribosomal protein S1 [Oscillospiraceae bacterium]